MNLNTRETIRLIVALIMIGAGVAIIFISVALVDRRLIWAFSGVLLIQAAYRIAPKPVMPARAARSAEGGTRAMNVYRVGREDSRAIYLQHDAEPSNDDTYMGMSNPSFAAFIVDALNNSEYQFCHQHDRRADAASNSPTPA